MVKIKFTPAAIAEVKNIMKKKGIPSEYGLRVGVRGGMACGGGGMSYILGFDKKKESDEVSDIDGITVYMEKKHAMYLIGMQIDHVSEDDRVGFVFENPNAKATA